MIFKLVEVDTYFETFEITIVAEVDEQCIGYNIDICEISDPNENNFNKEGCNCKRVYIWMDILKFSLIGDQIK